MRSKIKNKIQLSAMVPMDAKVQLQACAELLGIKPNEVMEMAIARLHAEVKKPNLSAKNSVRQLSQDINDLRKLVEIINVKLDREHDES